MSGESGGFEIVQLAGNSIFTRYPLILIIFLMACSASFNTAKAQTPCPASPLVSVSTPTSPADVCVPAGFQGNPIQFFDDFSWRSFIALVWPALSSHRGVPDTTKHLGDSADALVFETFKSDWELFQENPLSWNSFPSSDGNSKNPCGAITVGFADFVLASFSKFGNLGQAGIRKLIHALPAQNKTWVRYATAFNQTEYEKIVAGKLFILSTLQAASPVTFPNNSLDVKSAWIEMTAIPHPERYYTRMAWVLDPTNGTCSKQSVGLVGLHIVQKTATRPQWIWSTFEQVDNVPPAVSGAPNPASFAFNDATGHSMPNSDPNGGFPATDWSNPVVYNVERVKPINLSTQATNSAYQKKVGGVWVNYQLVMTQWPVPQGGVPAEGPIPASQRGTPNFTFPGNGATSAFANATLESWDQRSPATGCMACHDAANTPGAGNPSSDFVWTLQMNALSNASPGLRSRAKSKNQVAAPESSVERLKEVLIKAQ